MTAIPSDFIKGWSKMKSDAPGIIKKTGVGVIPDGERKRLAKDTEALFKTFDEGLKGAMQKAAAAKDNVSAKKALTEVQRIVTVYKAKVEKWGDTDSSLRSPVVDLVSGNLTKLEKIVGGAMAKIK